VHPPPGPPSSIPGPGLAGVDDLNDLHAFGLDLREDGRLVYFSALDQLLKPDVVGLAGLEASVSGEIVEPDQVAAREEVRQSLAAKRVCPSMIRIAVDYDERPRAMPCLTHDSLPCQQEVD